MKLRPYLRFFNRSNISFNTPAALFIAFGVVAGVALLHSSGSASGSTARVEEAKGANGSGDAWGMPTGLSAAPRQPVSYSLQQPAPKNLQGQQAVNYLKEQGLYDRLSASIEASSYEVERAPQSSGLFRTLAGHGGAEVYRATNRAQNLSASFSSDRVLLEPLQDDCRSGTQASLRLRGYGYGERVVRVGVGEMRVDGNRVEISRDEGKITEWYVNSHEGIEQGFTLAEAPGERQAGEPLRVRLSVTGKVGVEAVDAGQGVVLRNASDEVWLRYDHLLVKDAEGRELAAKLEAEGQEISLVVDDTDAVYPVIIDPLFTQTKKLTASDGVTNDQFGQSVAISGDTVVVGAYGKNSNRGAAYIYSRNQGGAGNWGEVKKLTASDAAANDSFGNSVSISGDTVVVGAYNKNSSTGAAYVFELVSPPTITNSFGVASIPFNGTTSLTFTITNPNPSTLTGISFSNTLPAGLTVANASVSTCSGTLSTTNSTGMISLTGASVAGSSTCQFSVTVTGTTTGTKLNTTGAITSTESGTGSTSNTATLQVNKADQTITVGAHAPSSAAYNTQFTVAATASSGLAVTYSSSGSCTNVGTTYTMMSSTGTCTVVYNQSGDSNYNAAPQVTESVSAAKASQTITFNTLSARTYGDGDFSVSATASSGLSVTFSASGQCTVTVSTIHLTGAGSCTVTASQAGNSNYNAATPVDQSFGIAKANQTINFGALSDKTYGDAPFNVSATGGASGTAVTFSSQTTSVCSVSGNKVTILSAGGCTIRASQAGNSNYNAATNVDRSFTVSKAGSTTTVTVSNAVFDGNPHGGTANVAGAGGLNQNLTVTYTGRNGTIYGLSQTAPTKAGEYTASATFAGDSNHNSSSDSKNFTISKATPSITWSNPADITYGTALSGMQLNATASVVGSFIYTPAAGTVLHAGANQTLHVAFTPTDTANYNAASKDVTINVAKATLTVTAQNKTRAYGAANPALTYSIIGFVGSDAQAGATNGAPALSTTTTPASTVGDYPITVTAGTLSSADYNFSFVSGTLSVTKADQTITFGALANKTFADAPFNVSATGGASGNAVTFGLQTPAVCSVSGNTVTILSAGDCTIRASQAGNSNYNAAPDVQQSFNIAKATTATAVTSSVNPSQTGQSVTFTATVTSTAGTPTGKVTFKDGASAISACSSLDLVAGKATCTSSGLTDGNHTITADYSGDLNFNTSTGTLAEGQQVNVNTSISISDVSLAEGNSGTSNFSFTVSLSQASNLTVTVDFATADGTALAGSDYQATDGTLSFAPGDLTKTITVLDNGDTGNEPDETFFVNLSNPQNATISDNQGLGTVTNDDSPSVQFSTNSYQINEGAVNTPQGFASLSVDVVRSGDLSAPATIKYFSADLSNGSECNVVSGQANRRCDYVLAAATLRFAAGETTKTINIPIIKDGYVEGPEFFTIQLQNPTGATLGTLDQATITIIDSGVLTTPAQNPYLNNSFFVRMNYLDFLSREPDAEGWVTWPGVLNNCGPEKGFLGSPLNCDRAHVAHGFIASREFTEKGYLAYRMYEVALSRLPRYAEFIPDMASMSGAPDSQELQQNTQQFAESFTSRQEFAGKYSDVSQPAQAAQFIARLEQNAGVTLSATNTTLPGQPPQYGRQELIDLRLNGTFTLGQTLKAFVEQKAVYDRFFERGFVTMQYFGFLRRDPDLNDPTLAGWKEWVFVFTNGGAERNRPDILPRDYHHLTFGFIYSEEYRKRFGQP